VPPPGAVAAHEDGGDPVGDVLAGGLDPDAPGRVDPRGVAHDGHPLLVPGRVQRVRRFRDRAQQRADGVRAAGDLVGVRAPEGDVLIVREERDRRLGIARAGERVEQRVEREVRHGRSRSRLGR
jgi:hypothetical protein